jgi:hypothetical protein
MEKFALPREDLRREFCPTVVLLGTCYRLKVGDICLYSHSKEDAPLCKSWKNGSCIGGRGNTCPLRHDYTERDGQVAEAKRFQDPGVSTDTVDFSSPYTVKVRHEVENHRREEVDLDTGRTRSWVETKEYEVLDLTGDTPAKPSRSPLGNASMKPNVVTNLARELRTADNDSKDDSGKMREISPLPGKQPPAIMRSSKRIPLADIMVRDGLGPEVDSNQCPGCRKSFKNSKGVLSHRSARNSSCKPGKNPLGFTEKTSGHADSDKENSCSSTEVSSPPCPLCTWARRSSRANV